MSSGKHLEEKAVPKSKQVEANIEKSSLLVVPESASTGPPPERRLAVIQPTSTENVSPTESSRSIQDHFRSVQRTDTGLIAGEHRTTVDVEQKQTQHTGFPPASSVGENVPDVVEESSDDELERLVIEEDEPDTSHTPVEQTSSVESDGAYHPAVLEMSDSSVGSIESFPGQLPTTIETVEEKRVKPSTSSAGKWWHYQQNIKGPKKELFDIQIPLADDPYQAKAFEDPAAKGAYPGVTHTARLRLGEGNDITPSVSTLKNCRQSIRNITTQMEAISEPSRRKDKMVLSSRLSRVRKRANHEANKIIFSGIDAEREGLISAIRKIKDQISLHKSRRVMPLKRYCEMLTDNLPPAVAGRKEEYVEDRLEWSDDDSD